MNNYKELKVWQKAIEVSIKVYELTNGFPTSEMFGLTSQIRRSSVSVAANIAEGAGRNSNNEFVHFLGIAIGSAFELETHLVISNKIGLINESDTLLITDLINETEKMLRSLIKSKK